MVLLAMPSPVDGCTGPYRNVAVPRDPQGCAPGYRAAPESYVLPSTSTTEMSDRAPSKGWGVTKGG